MRKIILALTVFVAIAVTSCTEQEGAGITPKITISAREAGQESISFNLELENADEAGYLAIEKETAQASDFTTLNIIKNATKLASANSQEVVVENLKQNVEYQVIAYCKAKNNDVPAISDVITMRTSCMVLQMGFFAYDGIDSASGRHRVNFIGSTRPRNNKEMTEYIDITLFTYLLNDPGDHATPGNYEPFQEDGSNMDENLVYKAGKHVTVEGTPNLQGSGWWNIGTADGDIGHAGTTGTHTITYDAGTNTTSICGTMNDTETGETFSYTYSTIEPLFRFNDY